MDDDHPLARSFRQLLSLATVRIELRFEDEPKPLVRTGSGVIVGHTQGNGIRRALILTAGHVIENDPQARMEWRVSRNKDVTGGQLHEVTFATPDTSERGAECSWYMGEHYKGSHSDVDKPQFDAGLMLLPERYAPEGFILPDGLMPSVLPDKLAVDAGTRVAWAGFPSFVEKHFNSPQICYYEGVVSAFVAKPGLPPVYLIDGHIAAGVSGGPVWWWNPDSGRPEVFAVATHYRSSRRDDRFPGVMLASPISPVIKMIESRGNVTRRPLPPLE